METRVVLFLKLYLTPEKFATMHLHVNKTEVAVL